MAGLKIVAADDDRHDFEMLKEAFLELNELPEFGYVEIANNEIQIEQCHALGATAYLLKGQSFTSILEVVQTIVLFLSQQKQEIRSGTIHKD